MKKILFLIGFLLIAIFTFSQSQPGQFEAKEGYQILYPKNFDPELSYPLILFLHGAGERGNDNVSQLKHGSTLFLDQQEKYPAIVLFPQCPADDFWANIEAQGSGPDRKLTFPSDRPLRPAMQKVLGIVEDLWTKPYVDKDRFYVTGLSMGGMGTWELLWRIPEKIAAAAPICGGGDTNKASSMKNVPIWTFHGVDDVVVPQELSIQMTEAVNAVGGKVKLTLYPGVNHNSWDNAFVEPKFLPWLFSHTLNR